MLGGHSMPILGWDLVPNGFTPQFDFEMAPLYLRALARIPYFERYAYPELVRLGLAKLWPSSSSLCDEISLEKSGWQVMNREKNSEECIEEGSMVRLTQYRANAFWNFIYKPRTFHITGDKFINFSFCMRDYSTRRACELARIKELERMNGRQIERTR